MRIFQFVLCFFIPTNHVGNVASWHNLRWHSTANHSQSTINIIIYFEFFDFNLTLKIKKIKFKK